MTGRQRRAQVHGLRIVVGTDRTAAVAVGGPEAGCARTHVLGEQALGLGIAGMQQGGQLVGILGLSQHGAMDGDDARAGLATVLLRVEFADAQPGRRQQHAGR